MQRLWIGAFLIWIGGLTHAEPLVMSGEYGELVIAEDNIVSVTGDSVGTINLTFAPPVSQLLGQFTVNHLRKVISISVCDRVLSTPTVMGPIYGIKVQLTVSPDEVLPLVAALKGAQCDAAGLG